MAIAVLDIDGTLVDTNYHHAIAWYRAFRAHGIVLPLWRIHRHIGMGGDQVVEALTGKLTEQELGDRIRATEQEVYFSLIEEVEPMNGSRELIEQLKSRDHTVVLASSAKDIEVKHYLDLLDARTLADAWTTSADVKATKPCPDLVNAALERVRGVHSNAVMVGDTPWDVQAANSASVPTIAVMTGGFGIDELRGAGAVVIFESVAELCDSLDETPLR